MPHVHHFFINRINRTEERLADITTYKNLNFDPAEAIRNGVLSTFDSLHSTQGGDHRIRNHLTHMVLYEYHFLYGFYKFYIPYLPPNVNVAHKVLKHFTFLWLPQNLFTQPTSPPSPTKGSMYFIFLWPLHNLYTLPLTSPPTHSLPPPTNTINMW